MNFVAFSCCPWNDGMGENGGSYHRLGDRLDLTHLTLGYDGKCRPLQFDTTTRQSTTTLKPNSAPICGFQFHGLSIP